MRSYIGLILAVQIVSMPAWGQTAAPASNVIQILSPCIEALPASAKLSTKLNQRLELLKRDNVRLDQSISEIKPLQVRNTHYSAASIAAAGVALSAGSAAMAEALPVIGGAVAYFRGVTYAGEAVYPTLRSVLLQIGVGVSGEAQTIAAVGGACAGIFAMPLLMGQPRATYYPDLDASLVQLEKAQGKFETLRKELATQAHARSEDVESRKHNLLNVTESARTQAMLDYRSSQKAINDVEIAFILSKANLLASSCRDMVSSGSVSVASVKTTDEKTLTAANQKPSAAQAK